MKTIKGSELIDKEFEVLEDGTLRLIENKKQGRYIPQTGEVYYYIDFFGNVNSTLNSNTITDARIINHNLVFKTQEECRDYKRFIELLDEYKCDLNWKDKNETKYYLYYDESRDYLGIDGNLTCQTQGAFYFKSMKDAKEFIKKAGNDNIKRYMFDVWE